MGYREATLLHLILQRPHEQSTTKGHNIVLITDITERIIEVCTGQAIDRVDCDLEGLCKILGRRFIVQILCQTSVEHMPHRLEVTMLDEDTSVQNIREVLGKLAKAVHCSDRVGMQRCDIQQSHVPVHARLGVDISTLTKIVATIHVLPVFVLVAREGSDDVVTLVLRIARFTRCKIGINQLRLLFVTKDDLRGECIGRVIDRHSGQVSQDLSCRPVTFQMVEDGFRRNDIVIAICSDIVPKVFGDRLIPRKTEFLMVNTKIDLPLLQTLLLGCKVINVRIRYVIRLAKERITTSSDDPLRKLVELHVVIADQSAIQNMIVVSAAVEAYETEPHQFLDLRR